MTILKRLLCRLGIHRRPLELIGGDDCLLKRCRWCLHTWLVDW